MALEVAQARWRVVEADRELEKEDAGDHQHTDRCQPSRSLVLLKGKDYVNDGHRCVSELPRNGVPVDEFGDPAVG
jgi:hypothetical protein